MEIHIEPIVFTIRLFADGRTFDNPGDPFEAVMTLQKMGSVGLLSGLCGRSLDRWAHEELMRQLKELGVTRYYCSRGESEQCKPVR